MEAPVQSVLDTYERALLIPNEKPEPQFMLAPVGLTGSGKTTVIKPLAQRLSLVRISTDEIRRTLQEHGLPYDHVRTIAATLGQKYLTQGYSTAIDSDCADPETQELIAQCEKKFGTKTIWIHIDPPEEFILQKLRNYTGDQWLTNDQEMMVDNYFKRKPLHEHLSMPFVYTFDTSQGLVPQLDAAERAIRNALGEK